MNTFTLDTTESLKLEFWQLDNEANVRREAQEKARREQEALIASGQMSEAVAASSVITKSVGFVVAGMKDYISNTLSSRSAGKPSKSKQACNVLSKFDDQDLNNIAADSIALCMNGLGTLSENALIHHIGEHVEHEFMLRTYRNQDAKAAKYLKEVINAQAGTTKQRYKSVEYSLSANRLEWKPWDSRNVIMMGQIVFHQILTHSDLFEIQPVIEVA